MVMVFVPLEFASVLLVGAQAQVQSKMTVQWKSVRLIVAPTENAMRMANVIVWLVSWDQTAGTQTVVEALMEYSATAMVRAPLSLSMPQVSATATLDTQAHCVRSILCTIH